MTKSNVQWMLNVQISKPIRNCYQYPIGSISINDFKIEKFKTIKFNDQHKNQKTKRYAPLINQLAHLFQFFSKVRIHQNQTFLKRQHLKR